MSLTTAPLADRALKALSGLNREPAALNLIGAASGADHRKGDARIGVIAELGHDRQRL